VSFYHLREKISYQLHSLGRHGVHSPFVFDFIEQVIGYKSTVPLQASLPLTPGLPDRYRRLLLRTMQYYGCSKLVSLQDRQAQSFPTGYTSSLHSLHFDTLLLLPVTAVASLQDRVIESHIDGTTIMAVSGLHDTPEHKAHWEILSADPSVTLSLDLFETGLLFFREDFLIKQHFRLKV